MSEKEVGRTAYFDYLRIIGAFMVMLLHVASYYWSGADVKSGTWTVLTVYNCVASGGVLLFVMISGALFLDREIPIKRIFTKYVLRLLIAYVFWSLVYGTILNWRDGIIAILKGTLSSYFHLWFLPMLMGLYICIPVFRLIVSSEKITKYFLVLSFLFAFVIPQILDMMSDFAGLEFVSSVLNTHLNELNLNTILGYSFFFAAGYYINKKEISGRIRTAIYIAGIAGVLMSAALTICDSRLKGSASNTYFAYFTVFVFLWVLGIFVFFKYVAAPGKVPGKFVLKLSKYSFGAYLVHPIIILAMDGYLGLKGYVMGCPLVMVPLAVVIIYIVSFLISALLNLIPGIKKYIV